MAKNSNYMKNPDFFFSKILIVLILFGYCSHSFANAIERTLKVYTSKDFGYITIDESNKLVNIYKFNSMNQKETVKIATCKITDNQKDYLTISSVSPLSGDNLKINTFTGYQISPDSLTITIKIPPQYAERIFICMIPSVGSEKKQYFTYDGIVQFKMIKNKFEYDNFFEFLILPIIDPFKSSTSWGDNETLSSFNLNISDKVDIYDPTLSELVIDINDFSDAIFNNWVIIDDFVLKKHTEIIWRNNVFIESEQ